MVTALEEVGCCSVVMLSVIRCQMLLEDLLTIWICCLYEGESNENLKYFLSLNWLNTKVHNYFIFQFSLHCVPYKCSRTRKYMHTSRIKIFCLRVQALLHRLLHLFFGPERLAPHRLFERSKDTKVTGGEVWRVRRMWETLKGKSWIFATVERAVWSRGISCWSKTPVLRRPRRLDFIAGGRWFFSRSAYILLVTVLPWACSAPKLPLVYSKRESS